MDSNFQEYNCKSFHLQLESLNDIIENKMYSPAGSVTGKSIERFRYVSKYLLIK